MPQTRLLCKIHFLQRTLLQLQSRSSKGFENAGDGGLSKSIRKLFGRRHIVSNRDERADERSDRHIGLQSVDELYGLEMRQAWRSKLTVGEKIGHQKETAFSRHQLTHGMHLLSRHRQIQIVLG
jgi:hypothetical protein